MKRRLNLNQFWQFFLLKWLCHCLCEGFTVYVALFVVRELFCCCNKLNKNMFSMEFNKKKKNKTGIPKQKNETWLITKKPKTKSITGVCIKY